MCGHEQGPRRIAQSQRSEGPMQAQTCLDTQRAQGHAEDCHVGTEPNREQPARRTVALRKRYEIDAVGLDLQNDQASDRAAVG